MNSILEKNAAEIQPHVMRRVCGEWLAVAPSTAFLKIGVTAQTEKEAIEQFHLEYSKWVALFKPEPPEALIFHAAKRESDVRKKNFLIALGDCYKYLGNDEISQMEPILHRVIEPG
jgi:hypothetical protein